MTKQEKEEKVSYLIRYKNLDKEIQQKREQIIKWRSEAEKVTTILSDMPKAKSREIEDKNAEVIAKIIDLNNDIADDVLKLIALKQEIEQVISSVTNDYERYLLERRYIDRKRWTWIAEDMHYSWQHLHKIHRQALEHINIPKK